MSSKNKVDEEDNEDLINMPSKGNDPFNKTDSNSQVMLTTFQMMKN